MPNANTKLYRTCSRRGRRRGFGTSGNQQVWQSAFRSDDKRRAGSQLGLYRCDRFNLVMLHKQKKEYFDALLVFLEVFYLDINGPQNVGHMFDPELDKGKKPKEWNPKHIFITPAVIHCCQLMMKRTKTTVESTMQIFTQMVQSRFENLGLPITPEEAWGKLIQSQYWEE